MSYTACSAVRQHCTRLPSGPSVREIECIRTPPASPKGKYGVSGRHAAIRVSHPKRSTRRDTGHCKHGNAQFFNDFTATPAGCFRSAFPQTWPPAPARASVCRTPKFPAHRRLRNFYYLYPIENSKQRALGMQYPVSVRPTHPPNREKPRIADLPERTSASSRRDGNAHEAIYRK